MLTSLEPRSFFERFAVCIKPLASDSAAARSYDDATNACPRAELRAADRYVHHNAWESLGAAAALAFLAGFLVGRRD